MTPIELAVRNFHARAVESERVMSALDESIGCNPDSPLRNAVWEMTGGYISALDAAYSIGGWLDWWWMECRLGSAPMQASLAGEDMRRIATIDDLVRLICDEIKQVANVGAKPPP